MGIMSSHPCFMPQCSSTDQLDVVEKKRLAELVRKKSGWADPVLINAITAKVGAAWNAALEDKRRQDDTSMEDAQRKGKQQRAEGGPRLTRQFKQKEVQFEETGDTSNESSDPSRASTSEDTSTQKKPVKKGPGYLLAREVERTIEAEEIAKKFWQQEARGFTNGDLLEVYEWTCKTKSWKEQRGRGSTRKDLMH